MARLALLPLGLLIAGCTASTGPTAVFDPAGDGFFDTPWPSNARTDADGTAAMAGFPNPSESGLVDQYLALAEQTVGFGANSPIYLRFDGPIDTHALPTPEGSLEPGSPLLLLDVEPGSPDYGEAVPVSWNWQERETNHQPADLLAVAPLWGFPLHPRRTYALVVTTAVGRPAPAFEDTWDDDDLAALQEVLFWHDLSKEDVASATVFTVADPLDEMARISGFLDRNVTTASMDQNVKLLRENAYFRLYEGRYLSPVFQQGDRPYASEGGGFAFDENGQPLIHSWDHMRLAISTPPDPVEAPPSGWPVVIYQHGTGGSYTSFASGDSVMEPAAQFAEAGMVGMGIDQPLHGTRGESETTDLLTFNYFNPEAGRANFRQGAIDAIFLAMTLAKEGGTFETEDGYTVPIDPERIYFMGHSQGGLTGALALPFLGQWIDAAVLSGAGGGLSITLVERKDPFDIAALLAETLDFDSYEVPSEFHPALGLIQWLVDVTDPINYAPYWFAEEGGWSGQECTDVLLFSGTADTATPYRTAEALAASGRLPWLAPGVTAPESQALRGLDPQYSPLADNAAGWDGDTTAAFSQWPDASHWVVFWDRNAARIYRDFLRTAAAGAPTVDRYATP